MTLDNAPNRTRILKRRSARSRVTRVLSLDRPMFGPSLDLDVSTCLSRPLANGWQALAGWAGAACCASTLGSVVSRPQAGHSSSESAQISSRNLGKRAQLSGSEAESNIDGHSGSAPVCCSGDSYSFTYSSS
jgi:hypothetical protein